MIGRKYANLSDTFKPLIINLLNFPNTYSGPKMHLKEVESEYAKGPQLQPNCGPFGFQLWPFRMNKEPKWEN